MLNLKGASWFKGCILVDEPSSSQCPHTHECMAAQLRLWIIFKRKKKKNTKLVGMRVDLRGIRGMNGK